MSTNEIISQNTKVRFVLDRSFLHDSFRSDYPTNASAKWLFPYLIHRVAITRTRITVISSTSIERWSKEFRTFQGVTPEAVLAVEAIADIVAMGGAPVSLDDSTLIVAKVVHDRGMIPVILSSVKPDKWKERTQKLGIKLGMEEFEDGMSDKRISESMWCAPLTAANCAEVVKLLDPLFDEITKEIGLPKDYAVAAGPTISGRRN